MHAPKKLLIVDDEPDIRLALSCILTRLGHEVQCAEDGFSALQKIREIQPDIILSDLNMPGMSGFELLSVIRRRLPAIYVIATSGAYSGEQVPHGIAADAFYEKAAGSRTLLRMLDVALKSQHPHFRADDQTPPIWISQDQHSPVEGTRLVINCPQCLRNFPTDCVDCLLKIHETECIYCGGPIHYAVIRPMDAVTSLANQPGLEPAQPEQHTAPSSGFVASGGLMVRA